MSTDNEWAMSDQRCVVFGHLYANCQDTSSCAQWSQLVSLVSCFANRHQLPIDDRLILCDRILVWLMPKYWSQIIVIPCTRPLAVAIATHSQQKGEYLLCAMRNSVFVLLIGMPQRLASPIYVSIVGLQQDHSKKKKKKTTVVLMCGKKNALWMTAHKWISFRSQYDCTCQWIYINQEKQQKKNAISIILFRHKINIVLHGIAANTKISHRSNLLITGFVLA